MKCLAAAWEQAELATQTAHNRSRSVTHPQSDQTCKRGNKGVEILGINAKCTEAKRGLEVLKPNEVLRPDEAFHH